MNSKSDSPREEEMSLQKWVQRTLFSFFCILAGCVVFASVWLWFCPPPNGVPTELEPPDPPQVLTAAEVELYEQWVAAYQKAVSARVDMLEATQSTNRMAVYELAVKDTLLALLNSGFVALIGFAFVKTGGRIIDNRNRMQNRIDPSNITLL